ncbi:DUF885 domain-containing protein [bacterium]|nr:DUF885 domain-containing protein [bacterium]|tara:strand:- start:7394 stop:9100 length:1707 start_codon:yes stop_codon:yes gene_type:complete
MINLLIVFLSFLNPIDSFLSRGENTDSNMVVFLENYQVDKNDLNRFHNLVFSDFYLERFESFQQEWHQKMNLIDFDSLDRAGKVDFILLKNYIQHELDVVKFKKEENKQMKDFFIFIDDILYLEENRRLMLEVDPKESAEILMRVQEAIESKKEELKGLDPSAIDAVFANESSKKLNQLNGVLSTWFNYYHNFDPEFDWWVEEQYRKTNQALEDFSSWLRVEIAGQRGNDDDPIIGTPIGREKLLSELSYEMIAYSPEEILEIAESEFKWCEDQMDKASEEIGFKNRNDALEHVKDLYVDPGKQDDLVNAQMNESLDFLKNRDLVTIPALAEEFWRLEMINARSQRYFPFAYYSGQSMGVAFATSEMDHSSKLQSMRGNNMHFSRNVTPHELIPGHHLQSFIASRNNTHRRMFYTPFYVEGWALYWEFRYFDLGWGNSPEDEIGMLFWRMHRAARIITTIKYHLNQMTANEMVDFLVDRVGHERDNAVSEVRRYIDGSYGPLYQSGYMLGGIQIRELHKELVVNGTMTERDFHDNVLVVNSIPIEMVRMLLTKLEIKSDYKPVWRFYD